MPGMPDGIGISSGTSKTPTPGMVTGWAEAVAGSRNALMVAAPIAPAATARRACRLTVFVAMLRCFLSAPRRHTRVVRRTATYAPDRRVELREVSKRLRTDHGSL